MHRGYPHGLNCGYTGMGSVMLANPFFSPPAIQYVSWEGRRGGRMLRNPYEADPYEDLSTPEHEVERLSYEGMAGCPMCPGVGHFMGQLGRTRWYRCRDCGWEYPGQPQPNPFFSPPAIDYVSYGVSRPGIAYGTPPAGSMGTRYGADRPFVPRATPFSNPYDEYGRYGHVGHYECAACGAPTSGSQLCERCHWHATALDNPSWAVHEPDWGRVGTVFADTQQEAERLARRTVGRDAQYWVRPEAPRTKHKTGARSGKKRKLKRRAKANPQQASGRYSPKAREFLSKKIKALLREGRTMAQARAIAMSMARERGLKVPPPAKAKRRARR